MKAASKKEAAGGIQPPTQYCGYSGDIAFGGAPGVPGYASCRAVCGVNAAACGFIPSCICWSCCCICPNERGVPPACAPCECVEGARGDWASNSSRVPCCEAACLVRSASAPAELKGTITVFWSAPVHSQRGNAPNLSVAVKHRSPRC